MIYNIDEFTFKINSVQYEIVGDFYLELRLDEFQIVLDGIYTDEELRGSVDVMEHPHIWECAEDYIRKDKNHKKLTSLLLEEINEDTDAVYDSYVGEQLIAAE